MEDYEAVDEGQPSFVQADYRTAADGPGGLGEEPMTVDADSPAASVFGSGEVRPGARSSRARSDDSPSAGSWRDRVKSKVDGLRGAKATPKQEAPTKERRPKMTKGRRVSAADTLSDAWGGFGALAIRGGHAPLGRCLQFQAPVAGEMLDEAVKGTFVDRAVLQSVVKARGRFDLLGAVLGPPMIVMAIERNPAQADVLIPILKSTIRSSLPLMVPAIKKVQQKEAAAAEAAAELFPDLPAGVDPVDEIVAMMFADFMPASPTMEEEEAPSPDAATNEGIFA